MLASVIIDKAEILIQDTGNVSWAELELLGYLNDAQRQIAILKPESSVSTSAITLTANETYQSLPVSAKRLVRITRNMGTGSTPGAPIRIVDRGMIEAQVLDWHTATGETSVKHYTYDELDPTVFYVYPRTHATTAVAVEATYTVNPTELTATSQSISVDDLYANAILDYILYRAYTKDSEVAANDALAKSHLQSFMLSLGAKSKIDSFVTPNVRK